eukprot:TRINITY_DN1383_c0_g1_i3.p1 TRINITY_DN1383_c0_g1~~TRINITY_DN1383_c0_g1_i3.p1  ORF type:complete len:305 (-),score=50.50 TRINITY_DN1383_c0_g1_i3:728-1615(-)
MSQPVSVPTQKPDSLDIPSITLDNTESSITADTSSKMKHRESGADIEVDNSDDVCDGVSDDGDVCLSDVEEEKIYKKRFFIVKELVTTEWQYVRDLQSVINIFLRPVREENILSDMDILGIFSNIEIIQSINKELYSSLQQRFVNTQKSEDQASMGRVEIGDVFLSLADYLKMYTTYVNNHASSLEKHVLCRKKISAYDKFITAAEAREECTGLQFKDFIIKPIQRLCKYPLIFRELVGATPKNHPDYLQLQQTYRKVSDIAAHVDRLTQEQEMLHKLGEFDKNVSGYPVCFQMS